MASVSCSKCGASHQIDMQAVSAGGKVINCPRCGNPISVAAHTVKGLGPMKPPEAGGKKSALSGIDLGLPGVGIVDLPMPKSPTPTPKGGPPGEERDIVDLLTPIGPPGLSAGMFDQKPDVSDLPAPVRAGGPPAAARGSVPPVGQEISDLPAPVSSPRQPREPEIADLPAPVVKAEIADLPAPVGPTPTAAEPRSSLGVFDSELPVPKNVVSDLPAPVGPGNSGATADFFDNLPAPKESGNILDVPAPKGFFDDVPASVGSDATPDVPAPKGFFDDFPVPTASSGESNASKAEPIDIESSGLELELGPTTGPQEEAPQGVESGSFDFGDLELEASTSKPVDPMAQFDQGLGLPDRALSTEPPPGGISTPHAAASTPASPTPNEEANSIDAISLSDEDSPSEPSLSLEGDPSEVATIELEPSPSASGKSRDIRSSLALQPPPKTDVGLAAGGGTDDAGGVAFDEVELPSIDAAPAPSIVQFKKATPAHPVTDKKKPTRRVPSFPSEEDDAPIGIDEQAKLPEKKVGTVAADLVRDDSAKRRARRRRRVALLAVLGLAAAGAGGYYGYDQWEQRKAKENTVTDGVAKARKFMMSDRIGHWARAARAAEAALRGDPNHVEALGLATQAHLAGLIDEGTGSHARLRAARSHLKTISANSAQGPDIHKGRALEAIVSNKPDRALEHLGAVLDLTEDDPDALLFAAWAHATAGKYERAEKEFAAALAAAPKRKIPALYGLARAQLELGKTSEAHESFKKVLAVRDDHVGALLGVVETEKVESFGAREAKYMAIVKREGLDKADPRIVSRVWTVAGDQALAAGRIDEAAVRFEKASKLNTDNIDALVGTAKVALLQNRLDDSYKILKAVIKGNPNHIGASLTAAELYVRQGKLEEAEALADKLLAREAQIRDKRDVARIHIIRGTIFETRAKKSDNPNFDDAIAAYRKASELSGQSDVRPAVTLAQLLSRVGRNVEAQETLLLVENKAKADPTLAITLGRVYAETQAPDKAEAWFRKALELRPDHVEAKFQLAQALQSQKRSEEAATVMTEAYDMAPERSDIGSQLAVFYEQLDRDDDARAIYDKLLGAGDLSVNVLVRAGMFFARSGKAERAAALSESILKQEPENPIGFYLKGVGEYAKGDYTEARDSFRSASSHDKTNVVYLEAMGRAAEKLDNDEEALRAYMEASNLDGTHVDSLLGQARIRIARGHLDKALLVLNKARDLVPEDGRIYRDIGICYQEKGEMEESIGHLQKALRYSPKDAVVNYRLGQAYYDKSELRRAVRFLTDATRLADPEAPWLTKAYLNLGYAQRSRGNRRGAIAAWENYLDRKPKDQASVAEVRRFLMRLRAR